MKAEHINRLDLRFQLISLISLLVGGLISWILIRFLAATGIPAKA